MAAIIADCNQVALTGSTQGGRPWTVVQHWIGAGGAPPDARVGAEAWCDAFIGHILPLLCHDTSVNSATYADLSSSSGMSGSITLPLTSGGDSGFMAPPNVCSLITMQAAGTRTQRNGRMYLPGVNEDQVQANGDLTTGYVNDLQDGIDNWSDALTSASIIPVVLSKASGGSYEPRTITGMAVEPLVATQRRRLRR